MERTLEGKERMTSRSNHSSILKGAWCGLIGGTAGTMLMDLVLMSGFFALGSPATTCFTMVGNTVAVFFSLQGVDAARSVHLGILTHYVVGPLIGTIFGAVVARVNALRVTSMKKSMLLGILYVEILSQPLLAMTPILLKMTISTIVMWYLGSFVVHMIVGAVLGAVVDRGLLQKSAARS
jgi:hypothetical protein